MDFNFDGIIDIVSSGNSGYPVVFLRTQDGKYQKGKSLKDKKGYVLNIGICSPMDGDKQEFGRKRTITDRGEICKAFDYDADGDLDIIMSGSGSTQLFRNVGKANKPSYSIEAELLIKRGYITAIADWDGDGLFDMIGGDKQGGVYFIKNIGSKKNPKWAEATCIITPEEMTPSGITRHPHLSEVCVFDYNDDGKLDIVVGATFGAEGGFIQVFLRK